MKLLVCDVEGTIFQPHMIKDAEHHSYIWTKIAEELGSKATEEELQTQKNWKNGVYGTPGSGTAYMSWVRATIQVHRNHQLLPKLFTGIIERAPYIEGVQTFFSLLNRAEYIPVLISGGIQNLNQKACDELGIERENSFAACEYYFAPNGKIDWDLSYINSCNFWGKEEIVKILLRKYGLGHNDWIFIGDGVNDVKIAKKAPISIGIRPVGGLEDVVTFGFENFSELIKSDELISKTRLIQDQIIFPVKAVTENIGENKLEKDCSYNIRESAKAAVDKQIGNLPLKELKIKALSRIGQMTNNDLAYQRIKSKISGLPDLFLAGQTSFMLHEKILKESHLASAILMPFCSAAEVMLTIAFVLLADEESLRNFVRNQSRHGHEDYQSIYYLIHGVQLESLQILFSDYNKFRNLVAHSYRPISIEAARSFVYRTYEGIQRLELILNEKANL